MEEQGQAVLDLSLVGNLGAAAEGGLRRLKDFLESVGNADGNGLLVIDRQRCIRLANRTALEVPESHIYYGEFNAHVYNPGGSALLLELSSGDPGEACDECKMRNSCLALLARNIATRVLEVGEARDFPTLLKVDGEQDPVEVSLHIKASPMRFADENFAVILIEDLERLKEATQRARHHSFYDMVGRDPLMLQLFDTIRQVGRIDVPVLIEGESGTGKEMVAKALHGESSRRDGRLVPVSCASLSPGLLESELFGHVKGAFTGASRDKKGRFELAHEGSIFLDEIGELSPDLQVKLLRVLQDGTFEPVGSEKTQRVTTRLICATNRKLEKEVLAGHFRPDLYYRLCVVLITVPPLRQRIEDLRLLVDHLLKAAATDFRLPIPELSPQFIPALRLHSWPGNVRELDNALRFALVRSRNEPLQPRHLPASVTASGLQAGTGPSRRRKFDAGAISAALNACGGNRVQAAKRLGISRATLYRYLAHLDLQTP